MASNVLVGQTEVNNQDVAVYVDLHGFWTITTLDGDQLAFSTVSLEDVKAKARGEINKRKTKYEAPFVSRDGKPGSVYGQHSRTKKMLIKIGDQKMQEAGSFRVFKPSVDVGTIEKYAKLNAEYNALRSEITAIERAWCVSIHELAQAAIKEAITAQAVKDALGETD